MSSSLFYCGSEEDSGDWNQSHFLEACFRCRKPLGHNRDIFMYRGITAFCSSECRGEQMEVEEAKERIGRNLSPAVAATKRAPPVEPSAAAAAKSGRVRVA